MLQNVILYMKVKKHRTYLLFLYVRRIIENFTFILSLEIVVLYQTKLEWSNHVLFYGDLANVYFQNG